MVLGIGRIYKSGSTKRKILLYFWEAFGNLGTEKHAVGSLFVGMAASSCWAGKWNRFVIVLAEQPSLIQIEISETCINIWQSPRKCWLSLHTEYLKSSTKEKGKRRRKINPNPPQAHHTYRNCHSNTSKFVIHRCRHRLVRVQAIAGTKSMTPDALCWGELSQWRYLIMYLSEQSSLFVLITLGLLQNVKPSWI